MKEFIWTEKYRPHTVDDCVLPDEIKKAFKAYVAAKNLPNLILTGPAGCGKTSVALAALDELDADYVKINAALKRGIDVIRDELLQFASTVSFKEGRKYVVLDEADGFGPSAQDALKAFIEEYSSNCGFIFTCNNASKLIPPIHSRCKSIDFKVTQEDFKPLAKQFFFRIKTILEKENITFDNHSLGTVITKLYPDWRQIINMIQDYAVKNEKIDNGILGRRRSVSAAQIIPMIKEKSWNDMRKWVGENYNSLEEFHLFARELITELTSFIDSKSLPILIDITNEYDYKNAFVMDKEINLVAYLTNVMKEIIME